MTQGTIKSIRDDRGFGFIQADGSSEDVFFHSSSVASGGFDADGKPTKIVVCPCSCANFAAGSVEVTLGCKATPSVE